MSTVPASSHVELPPLLGRSASPAEIRAALHPEYREEFDRDYRAALDEAGRSMELTGLQGTLESWRRRAVFTRDRDAYRASMRHASQLLTGEMPPEDEPVAVTEARVHSAH
jgi:hypothetical protein